MMHAPGLTPAAVFEKLATIQMVEVWVPTVDRRWLVLPRLTQPEKDLSALRNQFSSHFPANHRRESKLPRLPFGSTVRSPLNSFVVKT